MRTKTLLITAALAAAGIATSTAQTYSVNVVGYVQKTLKPGFQMIANPLDAEENTIGALLPSGLPNLTTVYKFNGATYDINTFRTASGWSDPAMTLAPGEGVFLRMGGTADVNVVFVGEVLEGELVNPIPAGFSIRSSQVPQSGTPEELGLQDNLGNLDTIYRFNGTTYDIFTFRTATGWSPAPPVINLAESFFIRAAAARSWDRDYTVPR